MDAKVIRFYANIPKPQPMDLLTIEDLKEAGFVPFRYVDQVTLKEIEDHKRMVHQSVPVAGSSVATEDEAYEHPVIRYEIGYGWEAKWGAVRFQLRSEVGLWHFMKQFDYPLPIDQKPDENS